MYCATPQETLLPSASVIPAPFAFPERINPAVADHINRELPAQIAAAYATAIQSDCALSGPLQS